MYSVSPFCESFENSLIILSRSHICLQIPKICRNFDSAVPHSVDLWATGFSVEAGVVKIKQHTKIAFV
ncbi:hypothetical protein S83_061461 [Arachis hypogaea]